MIILAASFCLFFVFIPGPINWMTVNKYPDNCPNNCFLSTAGLRISETHTKNEFANDRWKALGEENSDLLGSIFCDHLLSS